MSDIFPTTGGPAHYLSQLFPKPINSLLWRKVFFHCKKSYLEMAFAPIQKVVA